ncbi:MAG: Arm DNA-binding domain-containing protein [Alteromonadaceae bacterium]|nr:Arm DNA-binding domain-containing protein [Alteromonadaceae bacterium]
MKMRLTDLGVKKLSLPKQGQVTYWDETTPAFGVRCSSKSKSYVVSYGPERRLKTLGRYPDLPLAEARKRAKLFQATQAHEQGHEAVFDYQAVVGEYLRDCHQRLRGSTLKGYVTYLTQITFDGPISEVTQG